MAEALATVGILTIIAEFVDAAPEAIKYLGPPNPISTGQLNDILARLKKPTLCRVTSETVPDPQLLAILEECGYVSNQVMAIVERRFQYAGSRFPYASWKYGAAQPLEEVQKNLTRLCTQWTLYNVVVSQRQQKPLAVPALPKDQLGYNSLLPIATASLPKEVLEALIAAGVSINQEDEKGQTALHVAACRGDLSIVHWVLKKGVHLSQHRDRMGRTPLFGAVEHHHEDVVSILAKQPFFEANIIDREGNTVLDLAARDTEHPSMAYLLLTKGTSPTAGVDQGTLKLLSAAAAGRRDEMNRLLEAGVDIQGHDRLGYTALHEAACFGHDDLVARLIRFGVDVDGRIYHGGDTVLHAVIERGEGHRQFFASNKDRKDTPELRWGHVEVVRFLLRAGASARLRRSDGLTVQALVLKKLESPDTNATEGSILREIQKILKYPPCVEANLVESGLGHRRPRADDDTIKVCDNFNLQIQYHTSDAFLPREAPVGTFIYSYPERDFKRNEITELQRWATSETLKKVDPATKNHEVNGYWRWIHLPANNKTWVKDIISDLYAEPKEGLKSELKKIQMFIDDSYYEFRGPAPHARLRRPLFIPLFGSDEKPFSLVIPFFDSESLEDYLNREQHDDDHYKRKRELEKAYRHSGNGPGDLHVPCTLDQSYYLSLRDSSARDRTQVVVKHAEFREQIEMCEENLIPGESEANQTLRPLLMVNQIWLWKIDSNTFITAFPDRWHQTGKDDLLTHITQTLCGDIPPTLNSMIIQILHHTLGFVDAPNNAGLDENLFDIFEQSIALRAHAEAECYDAFYKAQDYAKRSDIYGPKGRGATGKPSERQIIEEERMCDITKEVEHLREIKDIRDELKMIERVLVDQRTVVIQYRADHKKMPPAEENRFATLRQNLDFRILKVQRLAKDALSVEASLNHLLDLKQKQGNLNEARDTRRLANEADTRARAGETQSSLLFIFTIITVIFTPISFVSTFLAVPSRDFPQNESGSAVSWRWWQVFVGALVAEVITFLATATFWIWAKGYFKRDPPVGKEEIMVEKSKHSGHLIPPPKGPKRRVKVQDSERQG